jgi:hypothetical protein
MLMVVSQPLGNPFCKDLRTLHAGFWKNDRELVSARPSDDVDVAALGTKYIGDSAQSATSD